MAVYTEVSDEELETFVSGYDIGAVIACKGIAEGIENSNYLLTTAQGNFILTLYERRVRRDDLPFFLGLMAHLAAKGIACPVPVKDRGGNVLRELCGRPAAIVSFLAGMWPHRPTAQQCHALGVAMAQLHLAGRDFSVHRPNDLSLGGWRRLYAATQASADQVQPGLARRLADELVVVELGWPRTLPAGVIHADLFPDNVFFLGDRLSGIIDFYFACNDFLAYDLAVALNAWCFERNGEFNITTAHQMIAGYQSERHLADREREAMPVLARGAALRFLLTRLYDWLNTPDGALVKRKDPLEFLARLNFHARVAGPSGYGFD
jgi:homoserine kinase type II